MDHIVLQTIRHTPLDEFAVISYLVAFYVLTMATFQRPVYGLAGLVLIEPFALYRDVGPTTLTLPKIAIAAVFVGLVLRRAPLRDLLGPRALPLVTALCAIVAATALSYFQADYKLPVIRETLKAIEYAVVFALAFLCYRMDPDERIMRTVFFIVAAAVSGLAISQEFTSAPGGMWISYMHAVPRIAGPLEGPNQLSGYLGLLLPVLVAYALHRRPNVAEIVVMVVAGVAEILTLSRAGVGATIIAVAIVLMASRRKEARYYAVGAGLPIFVGLVALVMVGGEVRHFFSTESQFQPSGLGTRSQLWTAAYRLWIRHPLLGIGAGNYELELDRVGFPGVHTHSNSGYIQALVEGGIPLLAAVLWMTWTSVVTFLRSPRVRAPLILGVLGASIGMAIHESLDYLLFFPKIGILYWALLGCAVGCLVETDEERAAAATGNVTSQPEVAVQPPLGAPSAL